MHPGRLFHHSAIPTNPARPGPVIHWMHREHRVRDNWTLSHAAELARERGVPLVTVYCLVSSFLSATLRQFGFLLRGLEEVERDLAALRIPFVLLRGDPAEEVVKFVDAANGCAVVADFDVLRIKRQWLDTVAQGIGCPFTEVDAHNVVPCRAASDKREYAARTIRPKIHRLLPEYLDDFPKLPVQTTTWPDTQRFAPQPVDWHAVRDGLSVDRDVTEAAWLEPGEAAARKALDTFVRNRLPRYAEKRNDPTAEATSGLSPYLHFGMLSAQRAALTVASLRTAHGADESAAAFLEELVVRRELAENFCFHTPDYDSTTCFPAWATATLERHEADQRDYLYDLEQLEAAATHDPLWNAAQTCMVRLGTMHGYLRMYWAKKILEWSPDAAAAMRHAIHLNDRYFLDGRDPNGYTGVAWSMGGVHDRPWKERPVFGTVRYMNFNGAKRKFDVDGYIAMIGILVRRYG